MLNVQPSEIYSYGARETLSRTLWLSNWLSNEDERHDRGDRYRSKSAPLWDFLMVPSKGLEPLASCSEDKRSIR
jgi:hypothetical protein